MSRPNNPALSGLKRLSKGMTVFVDSFNPSKRISKYLNQATDFSFYILPIQFIIL